MIMSFKQIHDEVTRLVNAITQGGGGGGGSTVSVVSKRTTGENIADITVNGVTTQLYSPDDAMEISFDPSIEGVYSGTNIQDVVDEITSDISSLNDTTTKKWKKLASVTGYTSVELPTEYDEILVIVKSPWNFTINVPRDFLTTSNQTFGNGGYLDSSTHPIIIMDISLTKVIMGTGTTNYTTAPWTVYYR